MIVTKQLANGLYHHRCDGCGATRTVKYEKLAFACRCVNGVPPARKDGEVIAPKRTMPQPPLLGDKVEEFLESYGISKEWYAEFKEKHGLRPSCGCQKRQEWLNTLTESHPALASAGGKLLELLKWRK